jgi:DNA-binding response OmpR family regulator
MKVLLVEDDKDMADMIKVGLDSRTHMVDIASDGAEGSFLAKNYDYDAIVLDYSLPKKNGLVVCKEIRTAGKTTPIIFLSATEDVEIKIEALNGGADDYLTKPFSFSELLARVQALIRRNERSNEPTQLTLGDLSVDLLSREVVRAGRKIDLQAKEFSLLEYFLRNAGRVLSKTMIMEHVWAYDFDPQTNVVDVLVCRLRNKIEKDTEKKLIHTLRGVGYALRIS